MDKFLKCCAFLALLGIVSFLVGRIIPKDWFLYDRFPFRLYPFERNGEIYTTIGICKWKNLLPDMSVMFPKLMPSKKLPHPFTAKLLERMIQETCVAEWIHSVLSLLGFGCTLIWEETAGLIMSLLYMLGNLPYVWIQRYNRPKLVRLWQKQNEKEVRLQVVEQE